jgi:ADP-ribosylation factor GTPase-activating protein 1
LDPQVREGGYDQKVNETVSVVAAKTTELGQMTWGIMRGVMAMASQQVEAYTQMKDEIYSSSSSQHGSAYGSNESHGVEYQVLNSRHALDTSVKPSAVWQDWDGKVTESRIDLTTADGGKDCWSGWDDKVEDDDHHLPGSPPRQKAVDEWNDDTWDAGFK